MSRKGCPFDLIDVWLQFSFHVVWFLMPTRLYPDTDKRKVSCVYMLMQKKERNNPPLLSARKEDRPREGVRLK